MLSKQAKTSPPAPAKAPQAKTKKAQKKQSTLLSKKKHVAKRSDGRIRLGGDCDGIGTPAVALEMIMGGPEKVNHVFGSESDAQTTAVFLHNHAVQHFFGSCESSKRNVSAMPLVHCYVAGAPCQDYAAGGKGEGENGNSGMLIYECTLYIVEKLPTCWILENSKKLLGSHWRTLEKIITMVRSPLAADGLPVYEVRYGLAKSVDNGLPTLREKCYVCGWKRLSVKAGMVFRWLDPIPPCCQDDIMEDDVDMPIPTDTVCLENLARMLPVVQEAIGNMSLRMVNANLDIHQSPSFGDSIQYGVIQTLTRARGGRGGSSTPSGGG